MNGRLRHIRSCTEKFLLFLVHYQNFFLRARCPKKNWSFGCFSIWRIYAYTLIVSCMCCTVVGERWDNDVTSLDTITRDWTSPFSTSWNHEIINVFHLHLHFWENSKSHKTWRKILIWYRNDYYVHENDISWPL